MSSIFFIFFVLLICPAVLLSFAPAKSYLTRSSTLAKSFALDLKMQEISRPDYAQIPLKIAVAGAGVGGLFLGYTLQKKGFEVTVFERSAKFSRFG